DAHAAALDVEEVPPQPPADVPPSLSVSEVLDWISNAMRMSKEEVLNDPACHPKLAAALAQDFCLGDEQASGLIRDAVKVMEPNYIPSPPSLNEVFDWIYKIKKMSKEEVLNDPACRANLAADLAQDFYLGDGQARDLIRDVVKSLESFKPRVSTP